MEEWDKNIEDSLSSVDDDYFREELDMVSFGAKAEDVEVAVTEVIEPKVVPAPKKRKSSIKKRVAPIDTVATDYVNEQPEMCQDHRSHVAYIKTNLSDLDYTIQSIIAERPDTAKNDVSVALLSTNKMLGDIIAAHDGGHNLFAATNVKEMTEMAGIFSLTHPEIEWCFVGPINFIDVPKLIANKNLLRVESINSIKIAKAINQEVLRHRLGEVDDPNDRYFLLGKQLNVLVQVDINENGCDTEEIIDLVDFIT